MAGLLVIAVTEGGADPGGSCHLPKPVSAASRPDWS